MVQVDFRVLPVEIRGTGRETGKEFNYSTALYCRLTLA